MIVTKDTPFRTIPALPLATWVGAFADRSSPLTETEVGECFAACNGWAVLLDQAIGETSLKDKDAIAARNLLRMLDDQGTLRIFSDFWKPFALKYQQLFDPAYKDGAYYPSEAAGITVDAGQSHIDGYALSLAGYKVVYIGGPACLRTQGKTCANGETYDPSKPMSVVGASMPSINSSIASSLTRFSRWFPSTTPSPTPPPSPPGVPPTSNPFAKPKIYDIQVPADAQRFDLTQAEVASLLSFTFGPRPMNPLWAVLHTQDGTTVGSLDWWLHGPGVQASANYMANRDGSLLRVIPETQGPWTNGDVNKPTAESAALRASTDNPNKKSLTCEGEDNGDPTTPYTDAQLKAVLWLFAQWMLTYGFGMDHILPHSSINSVDRANCPGTVHIQALRNGLRAAGFK